MALVRDLGIDRGRFFTEQEAVQAAQVAVVGPTWPRRSFPWRTARPDHPRRGRGFRVIGVQARLGSSGGTSLDRSVWMPLLAFERTFGTPQTLQVFAKAAKPGQTAAAEDRARATMRARRQLGPGVEDTFDVLTPEAARDFVQRISERIGVAAVPISIMALLAAVVVVTNTSWCR